MHARAQGNRVPHYEGTPLPSRSLSLPLPANFLSDCSQNLWSASGMMLAVTGETSDVRCMLPPRKRSVTPEAVVRLRSAAERICTKYPLITAVYLYGSAARGEPAADLDVAVLCDAACGRQTLDSLAAQLQEQGAPAGPELDVRPLFGSSPRYRMNVLRDGRLLYERDRKRRLEFEARSMSEWLDFKPRWDRMRQRMFERWSRG